MSDPSIPNERIEAIAKKAAAKKANPAAMDHLILAVNRVEQAAKAIKASQQEASQQVPDAVRQVLAPHQTSSKGMAQLRECIEQQTEAINDLREQAYHATSEASEARLWSQCALGAALGAVALSLIALGLWLLL